MYYRKDAILELAWGTPSAYGLYSYVILLTVAALTSAYSFRLLVIAFYSNPNGRRLELSHSGVPLTMSVPLFILSVGSITAGYFLRDALIGWGTDFWALSITNAPGTNRAVASHMIPVWASALPLGSVFLGLVAALAFSWPMPWCTSAFWKQIYLFLTLRWQFDYVWNQQLALPLLNLGKSTWMALDKGLLEILGPRGLTATVTRWAVPRMKSWQTGTVHDYALVFQVLVVLGLAAMAFPSLWIAGSSVNAHAYTLVLLLLAVCS